MHLGTKITLTNRTWATIYTTVNNQLLTYPVYQHKSMSNKIGIQMKN